MSLEIQKENLKDFLTRWSINNIKKMKLSDYVSIKDMKYKNTFTYYLEYKTKNLGEIGGVPMTKFAIYQTKKDIGMRWFKKTTNNYAYNTKLRNNIKSAFESLKNQILEIVQNAQKGDFSNLEESTGLFPMIKFKIAFLYQNFHKIKILPVYSKDKLKEYLGIEDRNISMLDLYKIAIEREKIKTFSDSINFSQKVFHKDVELIDKDEYVGHKISKKGNRDNLVVLDKREYSDVHSCIQNKLKQYLQNDGYTVITEATHRNDNSKIDLVAQKDGKTIYYEVKPYNKSIHCIREALGQLLEYCYYEKSDKYHHADELVIVGPIDIDEYGRKFLEKLKEKHNIPIDYCCIDV